MELVSNAWHVIAAGLVFLAGGALMAWLARGFRTSAGRALGLYAWHTAFCIVYIIYVLAVGGDALGYYHASLSGYIDFTLGTAAIEVFTSLFTAVMGMSLLGTFLGYNVLGAIGLLAVDASLQDALGERSRRLRLVATLVVLLPSVSFWSSAIGKDSVAFLATGLALWAAHDMRSRTLLMVLAVVLMAMVRPHIAALMAGAVAVSTLFQRQATPGRRLAMGGLAAVATAVLLPVAIGTLGLGTDPAVSHLAEYIEERQYQNLDGGGSIDISNMSPPMQLFTYLFRPLPFEAHNIPALAASLDNVVLLLLVAAGVASLLHAGRLEAGAANRAFLWTYVLACWILLALTTANLGISVRQKWMFVPMLVYLVLTTLGARMPAAGSLRVRAPGRGGG